MKLSLVFSLAYLYNPTLGHDQPHVSIDKTKVTYRGFISKSVEHFQNIRFAHETSGVRRFAPPEAFIPDENTIIDATSPGFSCPQHKDAMPPFFFKTDQMSEDCLNLRIARPAGLGVASQRKLPVVVWLHGGGVVKGSAYDGHFDPQNLIDLSVSDGNPIVYVALNYRLSIFGFPRLPILERQKSLNLGIRDQRMGLEWIQENIQHFGGDPERVTVFGLSAGGTFISMHPMVYGGTKGVPFQQAWAMSGPPGTALNMTSKVTTMHTMAVAENSGCGNLSESGTLDCLRRIPMEKLLQNALQYSVSNFPPAGLFTFIPSVDGDFFPDGLSRLVDQGKFAKGVRLILGWTQDDGAMNVGPGHLIQTEEDMINSLKSFAKALKSGQISKFFALYPSEDFQQELENYKARKTSQDPEISVHYFRISRIIRDLLFTCSSITYAHQMAKQTRATIEPDLILSDFTL